MRRIMRQVRRAQDITHKQIADELGISRCTYTQIETGRTNSDILTLMKIRKILGYEGVEILLTDAQLEELAQFMEDGESAKKEEMEGQISLTKEAM